MTDGGPGGWPSGWNVYYVVVLAGALALLLPLMLWAVSRALSRRVSPRNGQASERESAGTLIRSENPAERGRKSNPRIFQALSAAFILILLALLMIPCAVTLPQARGKSMMGLVCVLSLSFVAGLALLYGVRKRDLDWLRTWPNKKD